VQRFRTIDYERWTEPGSGVRARYWNSGHILGAASIELELAVECGDTRRLRVLFSGDIGPEHKLFHPDPAAPDNWDVIVMESTYGDRDRADRSAAERRSVLAREVQTALRKGGMLLIPAFAVERSQELLLDLALEMDRARIPKVPIFLDSPLAIRATEVFERHAAGLEDLATHRHLLRHPNIHFVETVEASKAIGRFEGGAIILAASGMCEAGRIRHHLKRYLAHEATTVLMAGFQAPGTLGHLLLGGADLVRIQGEEVRVRAAIRRIEDYSGHADRAGLLDWARARLPVKRAVYLTHGEEAALAGLKAGLVGLGMPDERVIIPALDDEVDLVGGRIGLRHRGAPPRLDNATINRPDWHNEHAALALALRERLEREADDKGRATILRRVRRALEGGR